MATIAALCLTCSSSLPPLKLASSSKNVIFTTNCCQRPICPSCLCSNPRLRRYDPCLACLAGVDVVSRNVVKRNADGGVRDEDMFSIGDER
ncbi:hypothetical protein BDQ17DRAFT_1268068 [Cyathus striatus]|nr:hypothetical protein BDQ17DRAFT_1268068 [Cyathus striatus]